MTAVNEAGKQVLGLERLTAVLLLPLAPEDLRCVKLFLGDDRLVCIIHYDISKMQPSGVGLIAEDVSDAGP